MTTPTADDMARARKWLESYCFGSHSYDPDYKCTAYDDDVAALALEFARVRVEAQIEENEAWITEGDCRHEVHAPLINKMDFDGRVGELRAQLVEHPRQGTALTRKADNGGKEEHVEG